MTEREERQAAVVKSYESAGTASANAAELWKHYRALAHAFARDFPTYELPITSTNESKDIEQTL